MNAYIETIKNFIFPRKCIICGEILSYGENMPFCNKCSPDVPYIEEYYNESPDFDDIISVFYYKEPIRGVILRIKKTEDVYTIKHLSYLAADKVSSLYEGIAFDMLLPVPSSKESVKQAGFDRMDIFARKLSRLLKIKYDRRALTKVMETKKQHTLSKDERLTAQKDAFHVDKESVSGKTILLFDDIITTGSTLSECAASLKRAGAHKVYCFTIAATEYKEEM